MIGSATCPAAFGGVSSGRRPASFVSGVPANLTVGLYGRSQFGGVSMPQATPPMLGKLGEPGGSALAGSALAGSADVANQQKASGGRSGVDVNTIISTGGKVLDSVISLFGHKNPPEVVVAPPAQTQTSTPPPAPVANSGVPSWVWGVDAGVLVVGAILYLKK